LHLAALDLRKHNAQAVQSITTMAAALETESRKLREPLTPDERKRFESYVAEIFSRLGMDLARVGTRDTPTRWLTALWDMTEGYDGDPKIGAAFPVECPKCPESEKTHVTEGPISFTGLCEHHVLPIQGHAWIGYLAANELIGISKLTRIVRLYAKRFTSQERIAHEVADELASEIHPRGVGVYIEAEHFCTQARGVREYSSRTSTIVMTGEYNTNHLLNDEFRLMVRRRGSH
jgi:GTP cyclohydrolase I